jgi:sugar lactone lactonase YvrE
VDPATDVGLLGLAVDARGDVYGAVDAKAARGVWRFDRETGAAQRLRGTEAIPFPNGLAFDNRGNLYVSSSSEGSSPSGALLGGVWRIARNGSVDRVLVHEALGGLGVFQPTGVGANGIAYRHGVLYLTNTEKGTLLTVVVGPQGSVGAPSILASGPQLANPDGLALDVHGNVYVAAISHSTIVRVRRGGAIDRVADATDGLDWASSLAFGTSQGRCQRLYAVNYAIGPRFGAAPGAGPALLSIDVAEHKRSPCYGSHRSGHRSPRERHTLESRRRHAPRPSRVRAATVPRGGGSAALLSSQARFAILAAGRAAPRR